MSGKHQFLSTDWFEAVAVVVEEHGKGAAPFTEAKVNLVVTDTPFGEDVEFHIGSAGGNALTGHGHVEDADATLRTDYGTAAKVFTTGPQAALEALMEGKVIVQGDFAKLTAALAGGGPVGAGPMQERIEALTDVPE